MFKLIEKYYKERKESIRKKKLQRIYLLFEKARSLNCFDPIDETQLVEFSDGLYGIREIWWSCDKKLGFLFYGKDLYKWHFCKEKGSVFTGHYHLSLTEIESLLDRIITKCAQPNSDGGNPVELNIIT